MSQYPPHWSDSIERIETLKLPVVSRHPVPARVATLSRETSAISGLAQHLDDRWLLPVYTLLFVLIYSSAVLLPYGYTDDYAVLAAFEHGGAPAQDITTMMILGGRPVYALFTQLFYTSAQHISDLQVIRLVGVISIGVLAWVFYRAFRRAGATWILAFIAPILICVTPPFQLYAGWAAASFYPVAAILAGVAALLVDRIEAGSNWTIRGRLFAGAVVLEIVAMSIYQPAAMMLWVFAAIYLVMRDYTPRQLIRRAALFGAVGALGAGFDFLEIKLLPYMGLHSFVAARTALVTDIKAKVAWFALRPFPSALNVWSLRPSLAIGVGVAAFSAIGLLLFVSGTWVVRASKLALVSALLPATYIPNLVVADSFGPYRTQVALTSLVVVCMCLAVVGYGRALSRVFGASAIGASSELNRRLTYGAAALGIVASLALSALAAYQVTCDIAVPEYTESIVIQSQLRAIDLRTTQTLVVRMSCLTDSAAPIGRYDEIGLPSTSITWAVQPMVAAELHDISPASASIPIEVEAPHAEYTASSGSHEIDARLLHLYRTGSFWTYGPPTPC